MKKILLIAFAAGTIVGLLNRDAHAQLLLNEVYPGGGSASATAAYHEDFIELLNTSTTATIDVTGFTLAYASSASAAGTFATAIGTLGASAITGSSLLAPGKTLLINTGTINTGGAANPTADFQFTSGAGLSATSGAVRLENAAGTIIDQLGYGTTNNAVGTAATAPAISMSLNRVSNTSNNSVDFTAMTPTPTASAVPEPTTYAYVLAGLGGLAFLSRSRRVA